FGVLVAFNAPVLMIYACMLMYVKPNKAQRPIAVHPGEEVFDLQELARRGTGCGFRYQYRLVGEQSDLLDGISEYALECVRWPEIEPIDANPADIIRSWPPLVRGPDARAALRVNGPQPGDVARAFVAEQGDQMAPRGHEYGRANAAPREPRPVHLMPEADHHWVEVSADAVRVRAQITVVVTTSDAGDGRVGRVDLHEHDGAVRVHRVRERTVERFRPAAEVADQIGLPACGVPEVLQRP